MGMRIQYPVHWEKDKFAGSIQYQSPNEDKYDRFKENLVIYTNTSGAKILDEVIGQIRTGNENQGRLSKIPESLVIKSTLSEVKINGSIIEYQYHDNKQYEYKVRHLVALDEDEKKVLNIKYTAQLSRFENYLPTFQIVQASLKIIK